jgi:phospholipase/lecithinase/hemolysin
LSRAINGSTLVWAVLLSLLFTDAEPAIASPFSQLVVFGDSLSDAGNDLALLGIPQPPYVNGQFSNGPVWVDQFATKLGVPIPTASLAGGTNYAYGGAETGNGFSLFQSSIPNMGNQINTYLSGHTPNASQLFVVFGGHNNFLLGGTDPTVPVADIVNEITALANAGAKSFLVSTLMPLGELPGTVGGQYEGILNSLTVEFNTLLTGQLAQLRTTLGVKIYAFDTYNVVEDMLAHPASYGLTNVTQPAHTGGNGLDGYGGGGSVVSNPTNYLFWDTVHPTSTAQQYFANAALAAVPEPSSIVLAAFGFIGLAAWGWRRRFAAGW